MYLKMFFFQPGFGSKLRSLLTLHQSKYKAGLLAYYLSYRVAIKSFFYVLIDITETNKWSYINISVFFEIWLYQSIYDNVFY